MRQEYKHPVVPSEGLPLITTLSQKFSDLADWVEENGEPCPDKKVALRKLEEAYYYASKSILLAYPRVERGN